MMRRSKMIKMMVCLFVFALLMAPVSVYGSIMPYEDVKAEDWFCEATDYLYEKEIMTGLTETQFGPYENLSRAQLVTILYRMHGSPEQGYINTSPQIFADITEDDWYGWYGSALSWAWNYSVVKGYENDCFGPADNITREQLCVMLYRYAKGAGMDVTNLADLSMFYDAAGVSAFAADAVKWAVGAGVLTGKANGTVLDLHGTATRAEAAVMMYRFDRQKNEVITGYKVLIDENDITTEIDVEYYKNIDRILVPFVKTMEAAGADIEWIEESCVKILYKDMEYTIDMEDGELIDESTGRSFDIPLSELDTLSKITENELYLDLEKFEGLLRWTYVYFNHKVDHQNQTVVIDFLDDVIESEAYKLIVLGQELPEGELVEIHKNYSYDLLPFTAIIDALGAEINWTDETVAEINVNGRNFILDTNIPSLEETDGWDHLLFPLVGGRSYYKVMDKEILLDAHNLKYGTLKELGLNVDIQIDYEQKVVEIFYE